MLCRDGLRVLELPNPAEPDQEHRSSQSEFLSNGLQKGLVLLYIDFPLVALIPRLVDLVVCWLRSLVKPNRFFEHLLDRFVELTRVYSNSLWFS